MQMFPYRLTQIHLENGRQYGRREISIIFFQFVLVETGEQGAHAVPSDVNKDWTCKDMHKDKDQAYKDQDKDKDLNLVLTKSLRTRTRINVTASSALLVIHAEHVVHRRGYCFHFGCMFVCMLAL